MCRTTREMTVFLEICCFFTALRGGWEYVAMADVSSKKGSLNKDIPTTYQSILSSPYRVKGLSLKNRIPMVLLHLEYADPDGTGSPLMLDHFTEMTVGYPKNCRILCISGKTCKGGDFKRSGNPWWHRVSARAVPINTAALSRTGDVIESSEKWIWRS